jgi:hypothetical protein
MCCVLPPARGVRSIELLHCVRERSEDLKPQVISASKVPVQLIVHTYIKKIFCRFATLGHDVTFSLPDSRAGPIASPFPYSLAHPVSLFRPPIAEGCVDGCVHYCSRGLVVGSLG